MHATVAARASNIASACIAAIKPKEASQQTAFTRAVSAEQDLYLKRPRKLDPCLKCRTCISPMRLFTIKFNRRRDGERRLKIKFNIAVRLRRDRTAINAPISARRLLLHHAQERIHVLHPGRVRRVPDRVLFVLDVAHHAAEYHVAAHDRHAHRSARNIGIGKEIFL